MDPTGLYSDSTALYEQAAIVAPPPTLTTTLTYRFLVHLHQTSVNRYLD